MHFLKTQTYSSNVKGVNPFININNHRNKSFCNLASSGLNAQSEDEVITSFVKQSFNIFSSGLG